MDHGRQSSKEGPSRRRAIRASPKRPEKQVLMSILGAIPNLLDPIFTSFSKSFLKSWLPIHLNWPTSSRWLLVELTSAWVRGFDELCLPSPYMILFSRRTQLLVQGAGQGRRVHAQCRRTFKSSELPTTRARYQWRAIIGDR